MAQVSDCDKRSSLLQECVNELRKVLQNYSSGRKFVGKCQKHFKLRLLIGETFKAKISNDMATERMQTVTL